MIRRLLDTFCRIVWTLPFVALTAAPGLADPLDWIVDPADPQPGDVVRVSFRIAPGADAGHVTFAGTSIPGFLTGGVFSAFFGIDVDVKPGVYPIVHQAGTMEIQSEITVHAKEFATERLNVSKKFTELDSKTLVRVGAERKQLDAIFSSVTDEKFWTKSFVKPCAGKVGSPFGLRRFFNGKPKKPHSGIDIKASTGTEVYASNDGRVVLAADLYFTGNTVVIDHGFGLYTYYAHLSAMKVGEGQPVGRSELIGLVGATGRVTGPHLHWGAKIGGARVDASTLPGVLM